MFLRARVGPFRSPQASGDWLELTQSAEFYASTNSDSRCYFHRVSPPKESMKAFLENRRLFMSIPVLMGLAILLATQVR